MKIRNIAVAGLMGLASIVPGKAQKPVQFIAETGVTGALHSVPLFYGGMNAAFPKGKNYTDVFAGVGINTNKQASFLGLAVNNYSWTKNISSWAREIFVASDRGLNSTLELSPIKANVNVGKFNLSLNPAYAIYNDFRNKTIKQGINTILQAIYPASPKDKIFIEAKYASEPDKNLFNTRFGKLENNFSYMISYMRNF